MSARAATIVLALALLSGAGWAQTRTPPSTSPPPTLDPESRRALEHYMQDPEANRREMLQMAKRGIENLPVEILVMLADANLRTGRSGSARRYLDAIIEQYPDAPSVSWAQVGLGWAALAHGDLDLARDHFERGANGGADATLPNIMLGLIDASNGDPGKAVERLDRLAAAPSTPDNLDDSLTLFAGYARYWAGDVTGAEEAFARIAASDPTSAAADDARYAMALARQRRGDPAGAAEMLAQMSNASSTRKASPESLADLDPRALMRSTFRRYRHHTVTEKPVDFLHGDGRALARASARRQERRGDRKASGGPGDSLFTRTARPGALGAAGAAMDAGARASGDASGGSAAARQPGSRTTDPAPATSSSTGRRVAVVLLLVFVCAALVLRRRTA